MPKIEIFLQVLMFGMTGLIVALILVRVFPNNLFDFHQKVSYKDVKKIQNVLPVKNATVSATQSAKIIEAVYPPTLISIKSIGLQLPIATGAIKNNQWTLYDDAVSWLTTSKTPGKGNVILYAHNREYLFGGLKKINIGDEIKIQTNEKEYSYLVNAKRKVTPADIDAVISDSNRLTLYTCDGTFDQKRLIVIALPK